MRSNTQGTRISRRRVIQLAAGAAAASALPLLQSSSQGAAPTPAAGGARGVKGTKLLMFKQEASIPESEAKHRETIEQWAKQSGVEVTMEGVALSEWAAKLTAMAETKQGADIVNMYSMDVAVNAPVMMDIGDVADEIGKKVGGWHSGPQSVCIQGGKWKALPAAVYGQYWHYRTDLFKEAGASKWPETWDELRQIGKKLKAKGKPIGFTLGHAVTDGATHCYSLLWSFGGKEFEADGKTIALDSPQTLACLEWFRGFYQDALDEGAFSWNESGNNQAFNSGQISATNNANTIYMGLLKNDPKLADVTATGGALKGPGGAFQYMSMQYWGIPTYSKNIEAAKAYLRDSFYDLKFQAAWTKSGNGYNLPAFAGLERDDSAWPTDPKLAAARSLAKSTRMPGYSGPFTPAVGQSMNKFIIIDMFAKVAQGTAPKEAIKWAVNEMQVVLKG